MNPNLDDDVEEICDKCNKRLAIVSIIWCLITTTIIFLIPKNYLSIFVLFFWLVWILIGIRLSPWIVGKIWKD